MLRPNGDPAVRDRVIAALASGQACWCPPVQLELWNGARGQRERKVLRHFANALPELAANEGVWLEAYNLARRARARGVAAPAADVLIAACARYHGVALETADSDFMLLESIDT